MSTIKSSDEHLTLNADGSSKDIKFQANGVEKASISSSGAFTSTTIDATKLTGDLPAISGANLTGITTMAAGGTMTGDLLIHKQNPTITLKPNGANNAMKLMFKDENDVVKFTLGYQDSVSAFRLSSTDINADDYINVDTSGRVTMPLQPAFMWKGVASNFTPSTSATTMVFSSEVFDIGNNAVNNRFTAPVAGVYHFDVFLQHAGPGANTETRYMQVGFQKNNTVLDEHSSLQAMEAVADGWGSGNSYHPQQISTNIQLAANDYVDITVSRSSSSDWNGTFNSDRTRWSGYLIG